MSLQGEDVSLNWRKTINFISTLMTNPGHPLSSIVSI